MPRFEVDQVQRYYDRQTAGFVAYGQGGGLGAIHRAVWAPGITTREQAFRYVEHRIATAARTLMPLQSALHLVDLGCGVGGSLGYLARELPMRGTGITLSPVQARIATARLREQGLSDRVTCIVGDYTNPPAGIDVADLAFAIESFVHGPSPERFFLESARLVRPGGLLIIVDDFRRPTSARGAERALEQFQRGWHINSLLSPEELRAHAASAGFSHASTTDCTPWLELRRPRDRAIAAFVALAGWLPLERTRVAHIVGGSALQTCLSRGWIGYDVAVFRRDGAG
jgi:SAM-dependent methyltransferase